MIQESYSLTAQENTLDQSSQTYQYQFKGQNGRQQNEAEEQNYQDSQKMLQQVHQGSYMEDYDDRQSYTKESCQTGANSSMEIEPKQLNTQKTKKKKTDKTEELRIQLLQAIQHNEQLKQRIILLQSLLVQTTIQVQHLQQSNKMAVTKMRKYSL